MKSRMKSRMAHPSFAPTSHPTFLSTSHAGDVSVTVSVELSLTMLRPILAHSALLLSRHPSPLGDSAATQLSVTGQRVMRTAWDEAYNRTEEKFMRLFTIMHIFEIPANNQYEATDELMRAREGKYDKVYLKKVLVKDAEELKPFRHKVNVFADPKQTQKQVTKMVTIFRRQLFGKE
jgi:hypothetical protein